MATKRERARTSGCENAAGTCTAMTLISGRINIEFPEITKNWVSTKGARSKMELLNLSSRSDTEFD